MHTTHASNAHRSGRQSAGRRGWSAGLALFLAAGLSGCAAISNPVANGLPVRRLPPELLAQTKEDKRTIPLTALRQTPPKNYLLAPGDVLGIWIEGVSAEKGVIPPVTQAPGPNLAPAVGLPVPVQEDGTLTLPYVAPLKVQGMTLGQAREAIREAYTVKKRILVPGKDTIIVTLMRRREYHVLVIRQDSGGLTIGAFGGGGGAGVVGNTKRGTGYTLDLPAYENDVLNALARTGGFPGVDALNDVYIERGAFDGSQDGAQYQRMCEQGFQASNLRASAEGRQVIRIPLRTRPGEPLGFRPEDVILQNGDILFIEERNLDLWYTGGLLAAAVHVLPRDRDLNVLQALAEAGFPVVTGGVTPGNLTGTIAQGGAGQPPPSLVTVLRQTEGGGQVRIIVEVNRALRDPAERLLIKAGDYLILQQRPDEAFTTWLLDKLNVNIFWQFMHGPHESGTFTGIAP